jgi:hypothetical protein
MILLQPCRIFGLKTRTWREHSRFAQQNAPVAKDGAT